MSVAALVIWNDTVAVIDIVADRLRRNFHPERPITPGMLHFQKLDVYQRSIEFLALAHRLRAQLPKGNAELADQIRRAAQSIPLNIAEGCGRASPADKAKHYTIARGSAMECASQLDVLRVDEAIEAEVHQRGIELLERIVAMLTKLIDP